MSERMPTEQLAKLVVTWQHCEPNAKMTALLVELLERRAADSKPGLTSEEREALEWVRHQCKLAEHGHPTHKTKTALIVLSRLLGKKGG